MKRRTFLKSSLALGAAAVGAPRGSLAAVGSPGLGSLHVAPFRFDVTPPLGHSLCGGWIKPVSAYDDSLDAIGFVLLGQGKPVVICSVDWTGILNDAHVEWRTAMAEAAGTTPDRVALHCVHQHNAPLVCLDAARRASAQGDLPKIFESDFYRQCLDRAREAISRALPRAENVTHVAQGGARVIEVASNRRVARDPDGRVRAMRGSASKDPALVALPEGQIDPWLRTIALYSGKRKIVAAHHYATHPMSYYGDGRVSTDFCGLARRRRQGDEPQCVHLYFTGCAGNIGAGKYNDGSAAARQRLTGRIYQGMIESEKTLRPEPLGRFEWRTHELIPEPHPSLEMGGLEQSLSQRDATVVARMRPAFKAAFLARCTRRSPFVLGALHLNEAVALYLPAEPFVEYQLAAQQIAGRPVAMAGYGDNGPWYIPTKAEFPAGGYEVEHAFAHPDTDDALLAGIRTLLA